jgi:hypothetical protein
MFNIRRQMMENGIKAQNQIRETLNKEQREQFDNYRHGGYGYGMGMMY